MLPRVLEPEVMDTADDAADYDAMDFLDANTRFAEDTLALVAPLGSRPLRVLDVGTGTARIPILLLERRRDLAIVAVDLAEEMLKIAARNVAGAGVTSALTLAVMDAKALAFPSGSFDLVMSNSTAHHVPEPLALFREIARVCAPGGAIVVRDLVRPDSTEDAWATVRRVAPGAGPRQAQLFFDSLHAALSLEEVAALVEQAGLEGVRVARVSDRHWTAERPAVFRAS